MSSESRNIVIVAYYFPPLGLAGVHRPLSWANYLVAAGHQVTVLTVRAINYPVHDHTLLKQLDPRVKVVRSGSGDPARLARFLPFLNMQRIRGAAQVAAARGRLFPDSKIGFVRPAWKRLKKLIGSDRDTIVITTSPPVSSHLLGLGAQDELKCRWVADWRDIWASLPLGGDDEIRERAQAFTEQVISTADLVSATSPKTLEDFRSRQAAGNYLFLPNGYDESDFTSQVVKVHPTIGIYGTINHLVGIEKLMQWLKAFRERQPEIEFRVRHTGQMMMNDFDELLDHYNLADLWSGAGYQPHQEAVQQIRSNAVNVIMLAEEFDTSYAIPSKLFELLRAEPPLIGILPMGGATRSLLEEYGFSDVYLINDESVFTETLAKLIASASRGGARAIREGVDVFERSNQLKELEARLRAL